MVKEIEINIENGEPKKNGPVKARHVLVVYDADTWQAQVLEELQKYRPVASVFKPVIDGMLLNIGRKLSVPSALEQIAKNEAAAPAK